MIKISSADESFIENLKKAFRDFSIAAFNQPTILEKYVGISTRNSQYSIPNDKTQWNTYIVSPVYLYQNTVVTLWSDLQKNDRILCEMEKVFNLSKETELAKPDDTFEKDCHQCTSITSLYITRFLIWQLHNQKVIKNHYCYTFDEHVFNKTFDEYKAFFDLKEMTAILRFVINSNAIVEKEIKYKNITIRNATQQDQIDFNAFYGNSAFPLENINHKDKILEYVQKIPATQKAYVDFYNSVTWNIEEKLTRILILSSTGNISLKFPLYAAPDNEMMYLQQGKMRYGNYQINLGGHNNFIYRMDDLFLQRFSYIYDNYFEYNLHKFDDFRIEKAFYRFKKSKSAINIDDKIIELMIGMEYLINTSQQEVTLQLKQYITKIYAERLDVGKRLETFSNLGSFYDLRSNVIHGKKEIKSDDKTLKMINVAENIFLDILFKILELTIKNGYSLDEIHKALKDCLSTEESLTDALKRLRR